MSASPLSTVSQDGSRLSTSPSRSEGPTTPESDRVTQLLIESTGEGSPPLDELIPLVYEDLRRIAHQRLRAEPADHTLNTTALVHESYLRLVDQRHVSWQGRAHFGPDGYLVEKGLIPLTEEIAGREPRVLELLSLDQALSRLAEHDPRLEQIVECRFFGGMTMEESASALGLSVRTAERDWTRAKAYLHRALQDDSSSDPANG